MLEKLRGLKTMLAAVVFGVVGVLQMTGYIDLVPLFKLFGVSDEKVLGAIPVLSMIVFGYLRYITTTPVGESTPPIAQSAPVKGVSE
jgi:hypothetical protein